MNDLISRRAAIKAIGDLPDCHNGFSDTYDKACIIGVLEELPSEERKKGKWIEIKHTFHFKCSNCGWINDADSGYNFCPDCGADMRGEEE